MHRMDRVTHRPKARVAAAAIAALAATGAFVGGIAAATGTSTPSNAVSRGHGMDQFGFTKGSIRGNHTMLRYTGGFWCDTSVPSAATSGCEAGAKYTKVPAEIHDELYITVPLGFRVKNLECPAELVCVDHPGTIDLTRLKQQLEPLYPQLSDAALTSALKNYPAPGHDHFVRVNGGYKSVWWEVIVVGVTDPKLYRELASGHDYAPIGALLRAKDERVLGPIPTNMFLRFAVR